MNSSSICAPHNFLCNENLKILWCQKCGEIKKFNLIDGEKNKCVNNSIDVHGFNNIFIEDETIK